MSTPQGTRLDGIDERLPAGERLLWEGRPEWRSVAVRRFHARKVALYFALLIVWRATISAGAADPIPHFLVGASWLALLGTAVVAGICLLGWLVARTTRYAITDRRLVMKVGIVLSGVVNIPLRFITSASVRPLGDGTGTIALTLGDDDRFAYLLLWPHARPWRFSRTEPSLLSVADADRVGGILREALVSSLGPAEAAAPLAVPARAPAGAIPRLTPAGERGR